MNEREPRANIPGDDGNVENVPPSYTQLLERIQSDPHSDEVWQATISLAKEEEDRGGGSESYYTHIPLDELITIGERLRATRIKHEHSAPGELEREQYEILAEKSSTGEYWYDTILGHVNDKMFAPVRMRLERLAESQVDKKFEAGLDLGSGLGNTLRAAAPYFKKIVGVEKLPHLVEVAKKDPSLPENAEMICASVLELEFADETFDIVVSNGLTRYLPKYEVDNYAREVSRVLKDGGRYLEAFTVKKPNKQLPLTEKEYLTSAKALLVCLTDNIVSKLDDKHQSWDFWQMQRAFQDNGVFLIRSVDSESEDWRTIKNSGVKVAEYIKTTDF